MYKVKFIQYLKCLSYRDQLIKIANSVNYYFGKMRNIPDDLWEMEIVYIAAGRADSNKKDNVLLIDAKEVE